MASQRVFITGASGFVGAHLCQGFARAGWQVLAGLRAGSDRSRLAALAGWIGGSPEEAGDGVVAVDFDLAEPERFTRLLFEWQPALVVHCAALGVDGACRDAAEAIDHNVRGTALLVEAAARVRVPRFVHLGSAHEYAGGDVPLREDAPMAPHGLYAASKAAGTLLALERAATLGLSLAVLRPFALYGPHENPAKLVPLLIEACLGRKPLDLSPGGQRRDYLYIDDFTRAVLALADLASFPSGQVFNIASGLGITLRELGAAVTRECGGAQFLRWGERACRHGEPPGLIGDAAAFARLTGWHPGVTLEEGIRHTVAVRRGRRGAA